MENIESKFERDLNFVMKAMIFNYNGKILSGEETFEQLIIDNDLLGKDYIIDWNKTPPEIKTK